jgi:hypothetical protein
MTTRLRGGRHQPGEVGAGMAVGPGEVQRDGAVISRPVPLVAMLNLDGLTRFI